MIKIITKAQVEAKRLRHAQHTKVVYFFTGELLPPFPTLHFQTSSLTITRRTLFVCQQSHHRD